MCVLGYIALAVSPHVYFSALADADLGLEAVGSKLDNVFSVQLKTNVQKLHIM
jgi:hypothetical protein